RRSPLTVQVVYGALACRPFLLAGCLFCWWHCTKFLWPVLAIKNPVLGSPPLCGSPEQVTELKHLAAQFVPGIFMLQRDQEDGFSTRNNRQLAQVAALISEPNSAPALTRIMLKRRNCDRLGSSAAARPPALSAAAPPKAATSKYTGLSGLWMNEPMAREADKISENQDEPTYVYVDYVDFRAVVWLVEREDSAGLADQQQQARGQTTAAVGGGASGPALPSSNSASADYEVVSDLSDRTSADAMVKNSMSRPTEIIDTSKLIEEGKVSTEYIEEPEIIEEQDRCMIDDYEKTFAYARRMRKLLNMALKEVDKNSIETNFLLIKAHEHPTQRLIDRWRNVDYGISYNDQVKRQKQIADYLAAAVKKKGKKGAEPVPVYPDLIRFSVRFKKNNSEKRWKDYLAYRKKMKKLAAGKALGTMPKANDKYKFAFQDIWSSNMVVFVKPTGTVRDIIEPVFARLGLERRADFCYTVGCFNGDKRAGKAKILGVPNEAEEVDIYEPVSELYKRNCTEIYVNDNRVEMFATFPDYYQPEKPDKSAKAKKVSQKKSDKSKNKSNTETTVVSNINSNYFFEQPEAGLAVEQPCQEAPPRSPAQMLCNEAEAFEAASSTAAAAAAAAVSASRRH
uniref:PseudoU_synth_2 domain-containing protein n=1 Tax=Macrostomum lignano TaxID=282301 RepID=A0A1I8FTU8_9PLAT